MPNFPLCDLGQCALLVDLENNGFFPSCVSEFRGTMEHPIRVCIKIADVAEKAAKEFKKHLRG